jgi:hypothetical protein
MATPENLHANIPDDQRHNPKGFDNAGGGSALGKNLAGELVYDIDYWQAPAIEFVDMALAPPSESNGDRYVLVNLTSSVVHADWDGAVENDIVEFYAAGTVWNALTPFEDLVIRDSNNALEYYFDGTAYQSAGGGGTIGGSGTADYISRFTSSTDLGDSTIRDNGTTSAINGAVDAAAQLKVYSTLTQGLEVAQTGTGAIKAGFNVVTSGANASTQYGGIIDVSNGTGEQRGLFIDVDNSSGGAGYGMQSSVVSGAGSNMDAGSFFVSGTNTARNVAGYFDAQNAGAGTAYAIYSNQGQNYLAEEIGVGKLPATSAWQSIDPNTTTKAHINLEGGTADVSAPNGGDLWYNSTTGTLNFRHGGVTTDLLAGGGGGNVSNTGTPANDQIAVWTNANTIEGSSQLIYQSGAFQVASGGGYIYLYNSGYMRMKKNTTANTLTIDPAYGNQTRSQIGTSAGADLFLQSGTQTPLYFDTSGNISVGQNKALGTTHSARFEITGSGTTSATIGLNVRNSSAATNFKVQDDGVIICANMPTSSAGLPAGALWSDSGTIKIV